MTAQRLAYISDLTDEERLVAKVAGMGAKPRVILLYNPTPYEIIATS